MQRFAADWFGAWRYVHEPSGLNGANQKHYCNFEGFSLDGKIYLLTLFNVIAVSETWTPGSKKNQQKPHLEGYQLYCGIEGKTLKSGCGFYIRNDIKYKVRKDLNISYYDEDNEFQGYWIEILNDKKPNIIIGVYYRHPKKNLQ